MATPNKQRPTRYWSEQYKESCAKLSKQEIRLQEALYEISIGEEDLVSDLRLIRKIYAESCVKIQAVLLPNKTEKTSAKSASQEY